MQLVIGSVEPTLRIYLESALHRNVEALHQGNWDAFQESIVPIFASKALLLDPKGIYPPGPSHTAIQNRSNRVRHQPLLWVPGIKLWMQFWTEMKIVNQFGNNAI